MKEAFLDIMTDAASGKTDADLIYMFYSKTQYLEEVIKEREERIDYLERKLEKLDKYLTEEECKKAEYGNPEDEIIYIRDLKKAVWGKNWVSKEAQVILAKRMEEENEPDRSPEDDKGSAKE